MLACILFTPYIGDQPLHVLCWDHSGCRILDYKMLLHSFNHYKENWYWYMLLEHDMVNLHLYNNSATSNLQTSDRWRPQLKTDGVEYAHHSNSKHQQNPLCWIILLSLHSVFTLDAPFFCCSLPCTLHLPFTPFFKGWICWQNRGQKSAQLL